MPHQQGISRNYRRACDTWKRATDAMSLAKRLYQQEKSINYDQFLSAQLNYESAAKRFNEAFEKEFKRTKPCADTSEKSMSRKSRRKN